MLLKSFLPCAELREYVRMYRILHFCFAPGVEIPVKVYPPRTEHTLGFSLRDCEATHYSSSKICTNLSVSFTGQQTVTTNRFVGRNFLMLQIVFHPTTLYRLTGISACEINNEYLDASHVFPADELRQAHDQMCHTKTYDELLHVADLFMVKLIGKRKLKPYHPLDKVSKLLFQKEATSLDWLARESCLSPKQFERNFKERVGIGPKLYSRIVRFDRAFFMKTFHPDKDWLSVAIQSGYYDYQHMVRDFKDFTGLAPTSLLKETSNPPEKLFGIPSL